MKESTDYWNKEEFYKTFEIEKVLHMHEAAYKTCGLAVYMAYPEIFPKELYQIEEIILKVGNSKWQLIPFFNFYANDTTGYTYVIERSYNKETLYYAEDDTRELALMRLCVLIQEDGVNIKSQIQEVFKRVDK